jgi:hypothetical protein
VCTVWASKEDYGNAAVAVEVDARCSMLSWMLDTLMDAIMKKNASTMSSN